MKNRTILFFYQLAQDLDVLLPSMEYALAQGFNVKVLTKFNLIKNSPRSAILMNSGVEFRELPKYYLFYNLFRYIKGIDVLVTATETNVSPHRDAHRLTKIANLFLKKTITLQHGYENLGLTYSDQEHPIQKIKFSSGTILTWSDNLHPDIPTQTRKKCVPAGIPKTYDIEIPASTFKERNYIAIFENLHWGRYSESYRKTFLEFIETVSKSRPDIHFIIKPHHAGKWYTSRYKGLKSNAANVTVLDPDSPVWEPYTAPAVIKFAKAVITTPSSVAIDAYFQNKPVGVLKFDLDLPNFNFSQKCETIDDVLRFINHPVDNSQNRENILSHENFLHVFGKVLRS